MDHVRNFQFAMIDRRLQASPLIRKESVLKVAATLANWTPLAAPRSTNMATEFHPLQDVCANSPGYDVAGILKTGALNRYYKRPAPIATAEEANPFFGAPLVPIEETRPVILKGNGKLAADAFDNLDSVEF